MKNCCVEAMKLLAEGKIQSHTCGQSENICPKCGYREYEDFFAFFRTLKMDGTINEVSCLQLRRS
jgi:hypothetical protein